MTDSLFYYRHSASLTIKVELIEQLQKEEGLEKPYLYKLVNETDSIIFAKCVQGIENVMLFQAISIKFSENNSLELYYNLVDSENQANYFVIDTAKGVDYFNFENDFGDPIILTKYLE